MAGVTLVSDIAWIKRGIPRAVPEKVKLTSEEIKSMIQEDGDRAESEFSGDGSSDESTQQTDEARGLRGSNPDLDTSGSNARDEYDMEDYDKDEAKANPMSRIAMFSSPLEDPYITNYVDSDSEEDKEDLEVRPDDNIVAVAKIDKGEYSIDVYLYNEANSDWYVHHDYLLDAPPLCLEAVSYDPGDDSRMGNLLAVGTMKSVINVWDLDIINAAGPVVTLGNRKSGKKGRRKRDGTGQGHTDAVLCLSWNRNVKHVLASGSADETIALWDLEEAKLSTALSYSHGKVQALEWHLGENSILLYGTLSGKVAIVDCRQNDATPQREWDFDGEVERTLWDHFNPFYFFVATDDGKLCYIDSRQDKPVQEIKAHDGGVRGLSQSFHIRGLIATCGADSELKIWKLKDSQLEAVHSETLNMGGLHSLRFSPDSGTVVTVGGEKEDLIRLISLEKFPTVTQAFSDEQ